MQKLINDKKVESYDPKRFVYFICDGDLTTSEKVQESIVGIVGNNGDAFTVSREASCGQKSKIKRKDGDDFRYFIQEREVVKWASTSDFMMDEYKSAKKKAADAEAKIKDAEKKVEDMKKSVKDTVEKVGELDSVLDIYKKAVKRSLEESNTTNAMNILVRAMEDAEAKEEEFKHKKYNESNQLKEEVRITYEFIDRMIIGVSMLPSETTLERAKEIICKNITEWKKMSRQRTIKLMD